jgi:nucleoid-associated protein YgaU
MKKDFKLGLLIGLFLVIASTIWLATRKSNIGELSVIAPPPKTPPQKQILEVIPTDQKASPVQIFKPLSQIPVNENIRIHIVQQGDTLTIISQRYYGSPDEMKRIIEANNLVNPNLLTLGLELIIPE